MPPVTTAALFCSLFRSNFHANAGSEPFTFRPCDTILSGYANVTLDRADGRQIITIRGSVDCVVQRVRVLADGPQIELFDDIISSLRWMGISCS
jgi:hypothetical protein